MSTVVFSAGWYTDGAAESPEMLEAALDKPIYAAGEVAKLKIETRQGGRALIAVLGEGLLSSREVQLPAGGGEIAIPVEASWVAGAYVTAMLYRPLDEIANDQMAGLHFDCRKGSVGSPFVGDTVDRQHRLATLFRERSCGQQHPRLLLR